jgi:cephalosporin hydroxylase
MREVNRRGYSYNFSWLGHRIIQYPQDMIALAEIIHVTKPEVVVETGVAHGGSLVFYASLLSLAVKYGGLQSWKVLGIEIDLRDEARAALAESPFADRIKVLEGSSTDTSVFRSVQEELEGFRTVMVVLDSNHSHDHVLSELRLYGKLVSDNCYLVVLDTIIETIGEHRADRPWRVGANPHTAVEQFLSESDDFAVDSAIDHRLLISVAPGGYLRRVNKTIK